MARKRFTPDEKEMLVQGATLEWQNGTRWGHKVKIVSEGVETNDGWESVEVVATASKGTVSAGEHLRAFPGKLRRLP